MLNVVVPMAGAGSRFAAAGYRDPKPLIRVHGSPMIKLVIDNLATKTPARFIFICQKQHADAYGLLESLSSWAPNSVAVVIDALTDGAARTVLAARDYIDNSAPLMIANSDQYVDVSIDHYIDQMQEGDLDGLIMTMTASDPKWSFVACDENGFVTRVVEKEPISDQATVGIYNYARGSDFVRAADRMIERNLRVNNEFYVAPTYNQLIAERQRIGVYNIGEPGRGMYGLGTPADLESFLARKTNVGPKEPTV